MSFRIFEHTADLGIEAEGDTAGECLSAAAQALACIVTGRDDLHGLRPDGEIAFTVEAPDMESLAVAFLSEVLWFLESESMLWLGGGADVEGTTAVAAGNGLVYDASIGQGTEVKAITYHELHFQQTDRWRLRVIIDI